ncbi:MFS transporter [Amycolatopsis sp. NPDC059027]|uniref:MFS transporter n=1 Tax=Amycolatopsis sp. NPDC059027 TaxID=3346709 RepID=UPI00367049ED
MDVPAKRGLGGDYWRLWTAAGLSSLADGVVKNALPLVAIGFTRSPVLISGLAVAFSLPWLVCALPVGALVDRIDRRRAMLGANVARAVLLAVLVLAMAFDVGSIWALYVVAVFVGVAETIYDTAAQSIMPQMVGREHLSRANGRLYGAEMTANEFAGPPLAGFLVAAGTMFALGTPVGLWAVAIVALVALRGRFRIHQERPASLRADIAEGLRFLWRQRVLRTFAVMVGVFNFATGAVWAVLALYAVGPESMLKLSTQDYGFLLTMVAAGNAVGSLFAERVERLLGRARSLGAGFLCTAVLLGVPAFTAQPLVVGAAFFVGGLGIVVSNVVMVSLRQRITPDRLLGRLSSAHRLVAWGTKPLGAAAGGLLAQWLGLSALFVIMSGFVLTLVVGVRVVTDKAMDAAERVAREGEPA